MLAAVNGYKEIVALLIDNGADIEAMNEFGNTALTLAQEKKHEDIVRLLKKAGAKVPKKTSFPNVLMPGHRYRR